MSTIEMLNNKYPHLKFSRDSSASSWKINIRCSNGRSCYIDINELVYGKKTGFELAEERLGLRRIKWFKKATV